jgi:sucrose phosphorylase
MKNQVQLITYVERLGGLTLRDLRATLAGKLNALFGAVHLLPFFHSIHGSDAGFDPIDHLQVDATLGTWEDVAALTAHTDVMADVIVNHMSDQSPQFLDYSIHGAQSGYAELFLTQDKIFPTGLPREALKAIYRPRPTSPFTPVALKCGETKLMWTTFTPQQIDIDVQSEQGRAYLLSILQTLAQSGVRMARLDAVGYAIKKAGSSCFMLPETFAFIEQFAAQAKALNIEVLVEVHSYYQTQIEIARQVDWVYDFALPPLVLHAFYFETAVALKNWLRIRPTNAVTVLDTHDGIGVIDIGADRADRKARPGLVSDAELDALVEQIHQASGGQSRQATGAAASNLDLYQVNCTYYDALGRQDWAYLVARAIQFFVPGVPQVYYVGLLAGHNDMDLLTQTGVGRDINRQHFSASALDEALDKPEVQRLMALIRFRNNHPAFQGQFELLPSAEHSLSIRWQLGGHFADLQVNFAQRSAHLNYSDASGAQSFDFVR